MFNFLDEIRELKYKNQILEETVGDLVERVKVLEFKEKNRNSELNYEYEEGSSYMRLKCLNIYWVNEQKNIVSSDVIHIYEDGYFKLKKEYIEIYTYNVGEIKRTFDKNRLQKVYKVNKYLDKLEKVDKELYIMAFLENQKKDK